MNHFQKIILLFIGIIVMFIGYYFVIHLPNIEQQKIDLEKQKYEDTINKEREKDITQEQKEIDNKNAYDECVNTAYANYTYNRELACKKQGEEELRDYNTCILYDSENENYRKYCKGLYDKTKKGDTQCTLYGGRSENIEKSLEKSKIECKEIYF